MRFIYWGDFGWFLLIIVKFIKEFVEINGEIVWMYLIKGWVLVSLLDKLLLILVGGFIVVKVCMISDCLRIFCFWGVM